MSFDPKKAAAELAWLRSHPEFDERPATMREFIGPEYLNIQAGVRAEVVKVLEEIFGDEVDGTHIAKFTRAIITGGIGIGKTTVASIILPYMVHWVLCLKDPQKYFNLLPGSRIAFMQMSTSEDQAKEVVFGDIDARIKYSPWFQANYQKDPAWKNQIRFPKDIWILPGDSAETTFEGYNILGGILDEADSHKVTKEKDYAESGYDTIDSRIASRFQDRGFLLVIGQMKKANGFAASKLKEFTEDPKAYARRMAIWESFGWDNYLKPDGTRDSFWYDTHRKQIVPDLVASTVENRYLIEIPNTFRKQFTTNPEKALRDLAGIPPAVGDPFISLVHKIDEARDRWTEHHDGLTSPVGTETSRPVFASWFRAQETLKRVIHLDMAYSANGDALGMAMGHVREVVEIDGEMKPYITFDMLLRMKAPAGGEIMLAEVRHIIYYLKDELNFKIDRVTMDGFQSTDTRQQLQKRRFFSEQISVDRDLLPYHDLREALYEDRIEFPQYMTYLEVGDVQQVEIAVKELTELVDAGRKIDHPEKGSKDVADAMAGVTYTLMGDRSYRRRVVSLQTVRDQKEATGTYGSDLPAHPALKGMMGLSAPLPPTTFPQGRQR